MAQAMSEGLRHTLLIEHFSGMGINIMSPPFMGLIDFGSIEVTMIGRGRVYPVSPRRLVGG